MNGYTYHELLPLGEDPTPYRLLTTDYVSTGEFEGRPILKVASEGLTLLADQPSATRPTCCAPAT